MKKFGFGIVLILLCLLGGFFWLLSQSTPANAPTDPVTVSLPDTFEN